MYNMEEWKDYFIGVLDGIEGRMIMGEGKGAKERIERERRNKKYQ